MKRLLPFVLLLVLVYSCKKTDLNKPPKITSSEVYTPPDYNPALLHTRNVLISSNTAINGIYKNPFNDSEIYLYGSFSGLTMSGSLATSQKVAIYNSASNSLSDYPSILAYGTQLNSFLIGSSGSDYFGGQINNVGSSSYFSFGNKAHSSATSVLNIGSVGNYVNAITEDNNKIYFTGDFYYYSVSNATCSPVLCYDPSNGVLTQFGSYTGTVSHSVIAVYHNQVYINDNYFNGYILKNFGSGSWNVAQGGFNGSVSALKVNSTDDKLYVSGAMTKAYYTNDQLNYVNVLNETAGKWEKVGTNNLPGPCTDIEFYGGDIYATGNTYIYKLDKSTNTWKSILDSEIQPGYITKLVISGGLIFTLEYYISYKLVKYQL